MNTINFTPSGAPAISLPPPHSPTADSPALDDMASQFDNLMNSAATAMSATPTAPSSALQSKLDGIQEASNAVINPSNDPAKNMENMIALRSQFRELQSDPEFQQLLAANPDRAADVNHAADKLFTAEALGDRAVAMEFAVSINVLVKGQPNIPDNPELLNQINEAMNRVKNNPGDKAALMNLQILMAQLSGNGSGAPAPAAS